MIRFIDINTGNLYNGDKPYVHWFDGKQSIGLNYDKQFIFLTDSDEVEIKINSEVFYLIDNHKIGYYHDEQGRDVERTFNDKSYYDLDVLKSNYVFHNNTEGAKVGGYYVFSFNIVAKGKYVGEITDTFTINGEEFTVGADFIDENESLGINLANFGAEISNEVQRAIYEAPLDEQMTDYVLINRKFKELLNEYINILGNKGSYKSLINSLNWFEYGDIVKLYEYWKHAEPNKNYLSKKDITQFVNEHTEEMLYSNAKTTFIGISSALEKVKLQNNEIVYENCIDEISSGIDNTLSLLNEPNPDLDKVSMLWSKEDMSLKMVLLGNFFATYFLPIHLDLIHCTIENIIYANTIKAATLPKIERADVFDEINEIKCEVEKLYHLKNIETFTNPNTLFGFNHKTNFDETDEALEILGVEEKLDPFTTPLDRAKVYHMQHFKGIGVLVPVKCTLCNVKDTAVITDASIKVYKYHTDGSQVIIEHTIERETDNIEHITNTYIIDKEKPASEYIVESLEIAWKLKYHDVEIPSKYKRYDPIVVDDKKYLKDEKGNFYEVKKDSRIVIDFNILIREIGNYKVQLLFRRSDGIDYIKVFDFEVDGENHPLLNMYKIVPRYTPNELGFFSIKKWIDQGDYEDRDTALPYDHIADYVFNPIQWSLKSPSSGQITTEDRIIYTQFISACKDNIDNRNDIYNTVHANQVFVVKAKRGNGKLDVDYSSIKGISIFKKYPTTNKNDKNYSLNLSYIIKNVNLQTGRSNYRRGLVVANDIVWFSMDRGGNFIEPTGDNIAEWTTDNETIYLVGICTNPVINGVYPKYVVKKESNADPSTKVWLKDMFIPYFYKLEKFGEVSFFDQVVEGYTQEELYKIRTDSNTYTLNKTDVVCFLPELHCLRRPKDFMWKFICKTNNTEITPLLFRKGNMEIKYKDGKQIKVLPNDNKYVEKTPFPAILQPLFGRYDFSILPDAGYYDVVFNYKLDDQEENNQTKTISSQFIISK